MIENQDQLRRIGGMATMPSRAHTLGTVLASILPQLDRLFVFFDKHEKIPQAFMGHPKIVPLLPSRFGALAGCGKFLGMELESQPCLYFCFDDDILYPPGYVEFMTRGLYRHRLQAVIGLHANVLKPPHLSYKRDRDVLHFTDALELDAHFDVLGTGTIAFHTGTFRFDPRAWQFKDMTDLMLAIEAAKQGLPRIAIRRPKNYLLPLETHQNDSIFLGLSSDDSRQTKIMREALQSCSLSWYLSPIETLEQRTFASPEIRPLNIDTTHGVVENAAPDLFVHRNLLDTDQFVAHLRRRERAYIRLSACLNGDGDALTIDDSTFAGAQAARLARKHGHAVTLFLNGYNIDQAKPYFFSRLNAALDATKIEKVMYEGIEHDLRTNISKQRFRAFVKHRFARLGWEWERQGLATEICSLLGVNEIIPPPFLRPITKAELIELAAEGVDIQNHGWTHVQAGALPPDEHAADIRRGREWLRAACGAEADLFAVPNGDGLPLWHESPEYRAWFLLDARRPLGTLAPGLFNRKGLTL